MGTARMKYDKETEEVEEEWREYGKKQSWYERKISPDALNYPNQNTIIKIRFYKRWKKYNEIKF